MTRFAVCFAVGAALLHAIAGPASAQQRRSAYEELQTFSGVLNHIRNNYADTVSYRRMIRAAIDGILEELDPHSYFLARSDNVVLGRLARGDLAGVGIHLEPIGDDLVVRTLDRDGPAHRAGVLPGDRLVAVDDTSVAGLDVHEAQARLAGRDDSDVRLRFSRGPHLEPHEFEVELERAVPDPSAIEAPLALDSVTTYVRVVGFGEEAARDLAEALKREADDGRRRIVLDLRGNPGGLVTEAVEMAALFLPEGVTVFSTRGRKRDVDADYVTQHRGDFRNARLVVLIDEGSASAAEALAGALQDLDRAVLVGRRTFGKALIQAPFFLPDGDIVWLTVGRVLTPSGRVIQRDYRGLTADQYRSFAGTGIAPGDIDSLPMFRTKGGRPVRGGGGIAPDVEIPGPPPPPPWWSAAREEGWVQAVVDEAAATLPASPSEGALEWRTGEDRHDALVESLLQRVRGEVSVAANPSASLRSWMRRTIAARTASVRWGVDAGAAFRVTIDPEVGAALDAFADWNRILAGTMPEASDR